MVLQELFKTSTTWTWLWEKSCRDWDSLPEDEELIKRIIIAVSEKDTNERQC